MGNIDTYTRENGGRTFEEVPFNDVDNLILSYLVYYEFAGIVPIPGVRKSISLKDAARLYQERVGNTQQNVVSELLMDMMRSKRFSSLMLSDRVDILQKGRVQFSALCVTLPDGTPYIVFRGVDGTVTGWQEAFETSFKITPSQKMSVAYVHRVLNKLNDPEKQIILGGHSKGGNLAIYSAVHLAPEERSRIRIIYQNDALGMAPGTFDPEVLNELKPRIHRLSPQYSIIDSLYKSTLPDRIIASDAKGLAQHEPYFWNIEGWDFVDADRIEPAAVRMQDLLKRWIASTTPVETEQFVVRVFGMMHEMHDEGQEVDPSSLKEIFHLIVRAWKGAGGPAKRAMLRLAGSAVTTGVKMVLRRV